MCTAIKGFVRLFGHYRHFIKDFARITDPLHEYARCDTVKKKKERVVLKEAARNAFHQLKEAVMSAQVLTYLDPNKEYLLETDALKLRLGGHTVPETVQWKVPSSSLWEQGITWCRGQVPQHRTQVIGHEVVYQTFPDLLVGSLLQNLH